jgi:hypothetical protein
LPHTVVSFPAVTNGVLIIKIFIVSETDEHIPALAELRIRVTFPEAASEEPKV